MLNFFNTSLSDLIGECIESNLSEIVEAECLEVIDIENSYASMFVYHMDLNGKDVVMCVHIDAEEEEELVDVRGSCKFSICSEDDIYKEEVGASIAVGRAVRKNKGHDFQVRYRKDTHVDIEEKISGMVEDRVIDLHTTLMMRDRQLSKLEEEKYETYQSIKQDLEEFK